MRYNKKNTKKTIQRKLTTRKRRKNNRSSFRTQYKIHKSYKQMKGGLVHKSIVEDLLNPINTSLEFTSEQNNFKLIGALIIKAYNELKLHYKDLPAIPHEPKTFTPEEENSIKSLVGYYKFFFTYLNTQSSSTDNVQISKIFSGLQMLSSEEFSKWLRYILEGNVYKKILPYYTDNEFDKFKSLALSLNELVSFVKRSTTPEIEPKPTPQSQQSLEYEKYDDDDDDDDVKNLCLQRVKNLCSQLVTEPNSILFGMGCVISLNRNPPPWRWVTLTDEEKRNISSNPYCAKRQTKRMMMRLSTNRNEYEPLDKINVSMLTYNISGLDNEYLIKKINEVIDAMLSKVDIDNIKNQFKETSQFSFIHIVKGNYKYYEIKIFRSRIYDPSHRTLTIPVIICMLSTFDEDGICDFEFVYVCVIRQPQNENDPPIDRRNYNVDSDYMKKLKQETYHKLTAEMTRLQSLLGGQTLNAPTTHAGTLKQYYDTIDLQFEASRTHNELDDNAKPQLLDKGQKSEDPCTLILQYEANEEPVWKAAKATTTQIAAFKRVEEYLTQPQTPIKLDNTSIHVFKISNGDKDKDKNITVFVEVKKQDENGKLLYVYYQALGGERYEVYNNSDVARVYADLNKAKYNWVLST
jgi:hypothetical protein